MYDTCIYIHIYTIYVVLYTYTHIYTIYTYEHSGFISIPLTQNTCDKFLDTTSLRGLLGMEHLCFWQN